MPHLKNHRQAQFRITDLLFVTAAFAIATVVLQKSPLLSSICFSASAACIGIRRSKSPTRYATIAGAVWPLFWSAIAVGAIVLEGQKFQGRLYDEGGPVFFFFVVSITTCFTVALGSTIGFATGKIVDGVFRRLSTAN